MQASRNPNVSENDAVKEDRQHGLRLLIADDSRTDRLILQAMLRRQGHQVMAAEDGQEAIELFLSWQPDMVLLDVMMPRMDGMEAAREIKAVAGETLVPVIFLTSLSDAGALAQCLEAGGDDFLSKPYNSVIIQAKIRAFNRMRLMHETLSRQRDLIRDRNDQLLQEQQTARRVFDNVAHTGCLDVPNIRYHASPLSIFNGDVLFACPRPAGGMHLLMGDFTGHGLPAAIGAMPMAEIFYGMTSKGFGAADVLRELNQKLGRILPTGMFCCAAFVDVDYRRQQIRVWNGGLPDGYLLRAGEEPCRIVSRHLPLGVVSPERFATRLEEFRTQPGDQLVLTTDGVLEAVNPDGEMFGEGRLQTLLAANRELAESPRGQSAAETATASVTAEGPVQSILSALATFSGPELSQDDLTLLCLSMTAEDPVASSDSRRVHSALAGPARWQCSYEVRDDTLGQFNPLPLLLHVCMAVAGLRQHSGQVYTLLAELYSNALEHGILRLPSEWKQTSEGFTRYYAERERRLERTRGHFIRFTLTHEPVGTGGRLVIRCQDSGAGFDAKVSSGDGQATSYAGRGILLLQELGSGLIYNEQGNEAEVVYHWQVKEAGD